MNAKIEEIKKMTEDQLTIKVAELMGYTDLGYPKNRGDEEGIDPELIIGRSSENRGLRYIVPPYSRDLDAMHEAEKYMLDNGDEWGRYTDILMDVIVQWEGYQAAELLIHASARQRAEAFILTMDRDI